MCPVSLHSWRENFVSDQQEIKQSRNTRDRPTGRRFFSEAWWNKNVSTAGSAAHSMMMLSVKNQL